MNARITDEMVEAGAGPILDILNTSALAFPTDPAAKRLASRLSRAALEAAAALSQPEAEGMVLVPREPTRQQIDACLEAAACGNLSGLGWAELYRNVYRTMLAATPLTVEEDNG